MTPKGIHRLIEEWRNNAELDMIFTSGAKQIYQVEGIPGFYRGLIPTLFGVSHGALPEHGNPLTTCEF
jgi:hypothetical protein